jgi:hypothetical protein
MNPDDKRDRATGSASPRGRTGTPPKKLRGDAARAAKLAKTAAEAAGVALKAESQRRTLLRVLSYLARQNGGRLEIPFTEVAKEPEVVLNLDGEGTPGAYLIALAPAVRIGDLVRVVKWRAWDPGGQQQPREDAVPMDWPGTVIGISGTHARVQLEEGCPHTQVDVWVDWLELREDASTRVDTEGGGGEADAG